MIAGRRREISPAAEPPAGPAPGWRGATRGRPSRFVAKAEPVHAVWHDGSDAQVVLVTAWVQQVADGRRASVEVEPGAVLVIRPAWPAEPVRFGPGMFLVLRAAGWTAHSVDQFLAGFEPLPRELPIFDDGEVA